MKSNILVFAALLTVLFSIVAKPLFARDPPLVLDPPVVIAALSKDGQRSDIRYHGQPAKDGRIDLTATNGFFDRCFEALEPQPTIPGDERFMRGSFGYLQ